VISAKIFFIMIFLYPIFLAGQSVVPSVSNLLRYGNGKKSIGTVKTDFNYFENLTDVRLSLPESFVIGFRLLYDDPPEIGERFTGIHRRYIEFSKDNFYIRAGNSSSLFGRGLALNLFENRGLAYDTWMDGVKASYKHEYFSAEILGGTIDFRDSVITVRKEEYKIRGGNIELFPHKNIIFGLSFIAAEGKIPIEEPEPNIKAEIPEFYTSISFGRFQFYFDYSHKWTNLLIAKETSTGHGIYSSLSYAGDSYGLTLDYKDYRYDIVDPFERVNDGRHTRMLPFQNPPIVMREHNYTLLTRSIHQIDFNDETGMQLEAFISPNENTTITLNSSLSSRHNYFAYNMSDFSFSKIERNGNYFPSFDEKLSPFFEIFSEVEYYFDLNTALRLGFARRTKTFYDEFTAGLGNHTIRSTVVPLQFQFNPADIFAATLQTEQEWVFDSFNTGNENFYNQLITVIGSLASKLTLTVRYEFTTNEMEISGRKDWLLMEAGYRITSSNIATISIGNERGGQVCSNGICRYLQPFEGIRASLQSYF
jgi:hypothetical protein